MKIAKFQTIAVSAAVLGASALTLTGCAAGGVSASPAFNEICDNVTAAEEYSLQWSNLIAPDAVNADRAAVLGAADPMSRTTKDSHVYAYTMAMYAGMISDAAAGLDPSQSEMAAAAEKLNTDAQQFLADVDEYISFIPAEPTNWMLSSMATTTDYLELSGLCLAN